MVVIAALSTYGQDAKHRAREFTPKYNTDTFLLNGSPSFIKRKVIRAQELKGIKSAFWDEQSHLLTIQYEQSLIGINKVKALFKPDANFSKNTHAPHSNF